MGNHKVGQAVATGMTTLLLLPAAGAVYVAASTHEAPIGFGMGESQASIDEGQEARDSLPVNWPEWDRSFAREFPACGPVAKGELAAEVVAVRSDSSAARIPFDTAWDLNHDDEPANNVWVVGNCR